MRQPLMPKAVAIWLIENTSLTFAQIADFCNMHILEIKGIADGEVASGILGQDPIQTGEIDAAEIKKCEMDPSRKLRINDFQLKNVKSKKSAKYTPVARRQDKPDAIAWFVKNYPEVKEIHLVKLLGTTKSTIESIRNRTHWNIQNIKPKDPVLLGLCTQVELDKVLSRMQSHIKSEEDKLEN